MARERVLITVKTYPTLSRKYGETVCTAGVRTDGSWMRIYPVPFRRLNEEEQYKKFDWIETDFIRGRSDPRPETRHPADLTKMLPSGHIGTEDNWRERRELLLKKAKVYDQLEPLMTGAKENRLSLAVFKPAKIRGFILGRRRPRVERKQGGPNARADEADADVRRGCLATDVQAHSKTALRFFVSNRRCDRKKEHDASFGLGMRPTLLELPETLSRRNHCTGKGESEISG